MIIDSLCLVKQIADSRTSTSGVAPKNKLTNYTTKTGSSILATFIFVYHFRNILARLAYAGCPETHPKGIGFLPGNMRPD